MMADEATLAEVARIRGETLAQCGAEYDQLDTNGDGSVDRAELVALAATKGAEKNINEAQLEEFFTNFDANGDGKVSREEWLTFFASMFDTAIAPILAAATQ